jgi:hypothetical protein
MIRASTDRRITLEMMERSLDIQSRIAEACASAQKELPGELMTQEMYYDISWAFMILEHRTATNKQTNKQRNHPNHPNNQSMNCQDFPDDGLELALRASHR